MRICAGVSFFSFACIDLKSNCYNKDRCVFICEGGGGVKVGVGVGVKVGVNNINNSNINSGDDNVDDDDYTAY